MVDYVSFRIGDVFPADDVLAQWVGTLSLAFNDIALVNSRMVEDQDDAHKFFYWLRLAIAHFAEAAEYLVDTREVPQIEEFVDSLRPDVQQSYRDCLSRYQAKRSEIQQIRNVVAFHYPELRQDGGRWRSRPMQQALASLVNETGRIKRARIIEARLLFADDIAAMLFTRSTPTWGDVRDVHADITGGMTSLMRFANPAVEEFLTRAARRGARLVAMPQRPGPDRD